MYFFILFMQMWSIYSLLRSLVNSFVREDASSYHKRVKRAQISKYFTILIHVVQSLSAHNFIVASVVGSNLGIKIAHKYRHVFLSCFMKDCLQLLVEGFVLRRGHVTPSIGLLSAEVSNRKARVEHMN